MENDKVVKGTGETLTPTLSIQRPFSCTFCDNVRYFDNFDSYRKHSRRHDKIFRKPVRKRLMQKKSFLVPSLNFGVSEEFTDVDVYALMEEILAQSNQFTCGLCGKTFSNNKSLQAHKWKEHTGARPFVCNECSASFLSYNQLRYHKANSHIVTEPLKCKVCRSVFKTKSSLMRHEKQHENYKQYKCHHCSKAFSDLKYFKAHERSHESGERPYKCSMCESSFILRTHLTEHEKTHYSNPRLYQCDQCKAAFPTNARLTRHKKGHLNYKKFQCDHCLKSFSDLKYLAAHERLHTTEGQEELIASKIEEQFEREEYKCRHCEKSFFDKTYFRAHEDSHLGKRPFKCRECECSYIIRAHLSAHEKLHKNEKPFQCDKCGKSFPTNARLTRHNKSHIGARPFICQYCGKGFAARESLVSHETIHNGLSKPYICQYCGKGFPVRQSLSYHESTHTGAHPFVCKCGKAYSTEFSLRIHVKRMHYLKESVFCDECDCGFEYQSQLDRHKNMAHKVAIYQCKLCPKVYTRKHNLARHERMHFDGNGPLKGHDLDDPTPGINQLGDNVDAISMSHITRNDQVVTTAIRKDIVLDKFDNHINDEEKACSDLSVLKTFKNVEVEDVTLCEDPSDKEKEDEMMKERSDEVVDVLFKEGLDNILEGIQGQGKYKEAEGRNDAEGVACTDEHRQYMCAYCGMKFMHKSSWLLHEQFHCDNGDNE